MLPLARDVAAVSGCDGASGHRGAEYWRREAIEARSRAGSLAGIHRRNKEKLEAVRAELRVASPGGQGIAGGGGRGIASAAASGTDVGGSQAAVDERVVAPGEWRTASRGGGVARGECGLAGGAGGAGGERPVGESDCGVGATVARAEGDAFERYPAPFRRSQRAAGARRLATAARSATRPSGTGADAAPGAGGACGDPGTVGGRALLPAVWAAVCRARICRVRSCRDHRGGAYAAHPPSALSQRLRLRRPGHRGRAPGAAAVPAHGLWDLGVGHPAAGALDGPAPVSLGRPPG